MGELYRRPFKVRKMGRGKQITVPTEAALQVEDKTTVFYDSFMVVVPKGTEVDEVKMREAIKLPAKKSR